MRDFIDAKLRKVLSDFDQSAVQAKGLCACKGLTYASGHTPNYSDPLVQQYYMLRYFPAYLVEYFLMYQQLLQANFLPAKLNVLSIGCGCGVDFWGLYFALKKQTGNCAALSSYTGIDLVRWQYLDAQGLPNVRFLPQNITAWQSLNRNDYNVFLFPKSIGEFPQSVFNHTQGMFARSSFAQDRVCGLCSLMDKGLNHDAGRFACIAHTMETSHKFQCLDDVDTHWNMPKNEGLYNVCSDFIYPNDIKSVVENILEKCPTWVANGQTCLSDCASQINKSPILRTSFIKYQLLRFERQVPIQPLASARP